MTRIEKCIGFCLSLIASGIILANPTGGVVVPGSGSATISSSGSKETIHQQTGKVIINWQAFDIGNGETTSFIQPAGGIALNRVTGSADPSKIFGTLTATGKVILINGAGIHFGPKAQVNVGGLIASTSDIKNENFMAGHYKFDQPGRGSIINKGHINAADYGLVALIGTNISNDGVINARFGNVVLASGDKFTVGLSGDQLINFAIDASTQNRANDEQGQMMHTAVSNKGTILADGGTIRMTASAAQGVVDSAINMSGIAQARSVRQHNGTIILSGGSEGDVSVSGKLDARAHFGKAGKIKVLGKQVHIQTGAELDARGGRAGGEILVGGNLRGQGPEMNADRTIIDKGATIDVSALRFGSGGKAIVWSNNETTMNGTIFAKGGAFGGNGGLVEVSGHNLTITGQVNTLAPRGLSGTLLLDPNNIAITGDDFFTADCSGSPNTTCTSTPADSVVGIHLLEDFLNDGNDIIQTTSATPGPGNGDINIIADITSGSTWASSNSLTLISAHDIIFQRSIEGNGSLSLTAANAIQFNNTNSVITAGSQTYTANSIQFNTPTIITSGGAQTYNGNITSAAAVTLTLTGGNSNIKFNGGTISGTALTVHGSGGLTNKIDLSGYGGPINILLDQTSINSGKLRSGTEAAPGSTVVNFTSIGGAIGNPTNTNVSLTVIKPGGATPTFTTSSTDFSGPVTGSVDDPFFFDSIFVPALAALSPTPITPNSVKYTPENNYLTTTVSQTTLADLLVAESLNDLYSEQYDLDKKQIESLSVCY